MSEFNLIIIMNDVTCAICGTKNWLAVFTSQQFIKERCMECKFPLHIFYPTWFQKLSAKYIKYFLEE